MFEIIGASFSQKAKIRITKNDILVYYSPGLLEDNIEFSLSKDVIKWKKLTDEEKRTLTSTIGWGVGMGILGLMTGPFAIIATPVGAIAGALVGGKKHHINVACVFSGGERCILDMNTKDFLQFQTLVPPKTNVEHASDLAVSKPAEVSENPIPAQEEHSHESIPTGDAASTVDLLPKLKQLHDAGILSDKEYEEKRAKLVAKL